MDQPSAPAESEAERLVRAWAECRADLEVELGLPMDKRQHRIEELIAQRAADMAAKPMELDLDPEIAKHLSPETAKKFDDQTSHTSRAVGPMLK